MPKRRGVYGMPKRTNVTEINEHGDVVKKEIGKFEITPKIAGINPQKITELLDSHKQVNLFKASEYKNPVKYAKEISHKDAEDAYTTLYKKNFFQDILDLHSGNITRGRNTGESLIKSTIEHNAKIDLWNQKGKGLWYNPSKTIEMFERIKAKNFENLISFDLETLSGKDQFGQSSLEAITEFVFAEYRGKDQFTEGTQRLAGEPTKIMQSIIGVDLLERKELEKIISEIETEGYKTNKHKVVAERLMMAGMSKNHLTEIDSNIKGLYRYSKSVSKQDVVEKGLDTRIMREGLDSLSNLYDKQFAARGKDGMLGYEKMMLEAFNSASKQENMLVGYNMPFFDFDMMKRFMVSQKASPAFKKEVGEMFPKGLSFMDDAFDLYEFSKLVDPTSTQVHGKKGMEMLQQLGLGSRTLEGMVRSVSPEFYKDQAAHLAETDVKAVMELLNKFMSGSIGEYKIPSDLSRLKTTEGLNIGNDLLYAIKGITPRDLIDSGVMAFSEDPVHEKGIDFMSNFKMTEKGIIEDVGMYPLKKGSAFTISSIKELDLEDEFVKAISKVHPQMAKGKLFSVQLGLQSLDDRGTFKEGMRTNLLGTRESIESIFSERIGKIGTRGSAAEQWTKTEFAKTISETASVDEIIRKGHESLLSDSAMRDIRKYRPDLLAKKMGIVNHLDNVGSLLEANKELASMISKGEHLNLDAQSIIGQIYSLNEYQGQRGTMDNLVAQFDYLKTYKDEIDYFIDKSEGSPVHLKQYLERFNKAIFSGDEALDSGRFFELDLSEIFKPKITLQDPSRLNINVNLDQRYGLAQQIHRLTGSTERKATKVEQRNILDKVNQHLNSMIKQKDQRTALPESADDANRFIVQKMREMQDKGIVKAAPRKTQNLIKHHSKVEPDKISNWARDIVSTIDESLNIKKDGYHSLVDEKSSKKAQAAIMNMLFPEEVIGALDKGVYKGTVASDMQKVRLADTKALVEDLVSGLQRSHTDLMIQGENVFAITHKGEQINLRLPKEVFQGGMLKTQIGGQYVSPTVGLYGKPMRGLLGKGKREVDKIEDIILQSRIGLGHRKAGLASKSFPEALEKDQIADKIRYFMKLVTQEIGESPDVTAGDLQDHKAMFNVNIKDIMGNLGFISEEIGEDRLLEDVSEKNIEAIKKAIRDKSGRLPIGQLGPIHEEEQTILRNIVRNMPTIGGARIGGTSFEEQYHRLGYPKNIEDYNRTLFESKEISTQLGHGDTRRVSDQVSRIQRFIAKDADDSKYGLFLSSDVNLAYTSGTSDRFGRVESYKRLNELNISDKKLRDIVTEMSKSENELYRSAAEQLERVHTEEGAAIMRLAEYEEIAPRRLTEQRVNLSSLIDLENSKTTAEEITRRNKGAFDITIGSNGEINFHYRKTGIIEKGQQILTKEGIDGAKGEAIKANYRGFLSMGVFEKGSGMMLSESDLNREMARRGIKAEGVMEYLHKEFDLKYFMEAETKEYHTKFSRMGLEKKTIKAIDDEVLDALGRFLKVGTVDVVTYTSDATEKHADIDAVIQELSGRIYGADLSSEQVKTKLESFMEGFDIEIADDDKLYHKSIGRIDHSELKKVMSEYGMTGKETEGLKTQLAAYGIFSSHVDTLHRDIIKMTDRHRIPMSLLRKEEEYIQRMSRHFGEGSEEKIRSAFEAVDEKELTLSPVMRSLNRDWRTRGDAPADKAMAIIHGKAQPIGRLAKEAGLEDVYDDIMGVMTEKGGIQEATVGGVASFHEVRTAEKAAAWNKGRILYKNMEETMIDNYKFKHRKITDMLFELNAGEGSDFNEALMIDLKVGELGKRQIYDTMDESSRYLAVPYFRADHYSEREAKTVVQQKVSSLQKSVMNFQENVEKGWQGISEEEQIKMELSLRGKLTDVKSEISKYSGKKKVLAEAATNYMEGARYTASGHIMYGAEQSEFLKGMRFGGESVRDLAARGIDVDYALAGETHFERYLTKDYLGSVGKTKDEMLDYLRTEGVNEILIREPQDYAKSTRFSKVYLDDTIEKANMLRIGGATVASMGGDFDSDFFALTRFNALATIKDETGERTQRIDYTQYRSLLDRGSEIDPEATRIFKSIEASMYETAYLNRAYRATGDITGMPTEGSIYEGIIRRHEFLDSEGFLTSRRDMIGDLSIEQKSAIMQNFEQINKNLGIDYHDALKQGNYASLINEGLSGRYDDAIRGVDIEGAGGAKKLIAQAMHLQSDQLKIAAQTTKLAAGESNYLLHSIMQSIQVARAHEIDITNDEGRAMRQVTLAFQEFFLAGKGAKEIDYSMLDNVKEAFREPDRLMQLAKDTIWERKELRAMSETMQDSIKEVSPEEMIGLTQSALNKINKAPMFDKFIKQTITESGVGSSPLITSGRQINFGDFVGDLIHFDSEARNAQTIIKSDLIRQAVAESEGSMAAAKQMPKGMASGNMLDSLHDMMRGKITGKNLAFSALGLAGAVMVAGFVGGNPLEPSTRQAERQSEDMYQMTPSMADQQMTPGQEGQQGYIININADTRRGRKHAEASIRDAVAMTQQSSNVNISMNIRDSWGNISDRDMQTRMRRMF